MKRALLGALVALCLVGSARAQTNQDPPAQGFGHQPIQGVSLYDRFGKGVAQIWDGMLRVLPKRVGPTAEAACTPGHFLSAANLNPTQVSVQPSVLCGPLVVMNEGSTTALDLRVYDSNAISATACASATGVVWNVPIPVNSTAANVAGYVISIPDGLAFRKGIAFCLTGAITDSDNTNAATGVQVNYAFRLN